MADLLQGKIIKGIAGFYYVYINGLGEFECKAKGIFRKQNIKPLVGDNVMVELLSNEPPRGNVCEILPRENSLIRPAVANIDQAMVIFSITKPSPNLNLLDRFIIQMEQVNLETIIVFNKEDLDNENYGQRLHEIYTKAGYKVLCLSAKKDCSMQELQKVLEGKTTTVAGPSGVGKSSIINRLQEKTKMQTGSLSVKIERGKHTTRHSEVIPISDNTFIFDTPGFSSLAIFDIKKEELTNYFREFNLHVDGCKFSGCTHTHEPICGIKKALEEGYITIERYESYKVLLNEVSAKKRY